MRHIDTHTIEKSERIAIPYTGDGDNGIYFKFNKVFSTSNNNKNLNLFVITRKAYLKRVSFYSQYINFFVKYYDEDKEYMTSMLIVKYLIDNNDREYSYAEFMKDVINKIMTDSVIEKITQLVNDEYMVEMTPDAGDNIDEHGKPILHALQFTDDQCKALLGISTAFKLLIPVLSHYYAKRSNELNKLARERQIKEVTIVEYFYEAIIGIFNLFDKNTYNTFNKLVATVSLWLDRQDSSMVDRASMRGITKVNELNSTLKTVITELIPKYVFRMNVVKMNHVSVRSRMRNVYASSDKLVIYEPQTKGVADNGELSGLDIIDANAVNYDDISFIISRTNITTVIESLKHKYNISVSKDELLFYSDNLNQNMYFNKILEFFAEDFGSYYDLRYIKKKKEFVTLMVIFKHVMTNRGFRYIQHIFTGVRSSKSSGKRISAKQVLKITNSPRYKEILDNYSHTYVEPDENKRDNILDTIVSLLSTPMQYLDFREPDHNWDDIEIDNDIVSDEYLRFIEMIM